VEIPVIVNTFMGKIRATVTTSTGFVPVESLLPVARDLQGTFTRMAAAHPTFGGAISCRPGCAACCRHLVTVAPPEAFALLDAVERLPAAEQEALESRFREVRARIQESLGDDFTRAAQELSFGDVADRYFHLDLPCPFLQDERCTVYEERPLVCRAYVVRSAPALCRTPDSPEWQRIVVPVDLTRALEGMAHGVWPDAPLCIPLVDSLDWAREHRHLRQLGAPGTDMVPALLQIMQKTAFEVTLGEPRPCEPATTSAGSRK
jgi:Fe-S-cluster containining protein